MIGHERAEDTKLLGGPGICSPAGKFCNMKSSDCWKCIEVVNPTINHIILYHLISLKISSGRPFWPFLAPKGVGACAPRTLPLRGGLSKLISKIERR